MRIAVISDGTAIRSQGNVLIVVENDLVRARANGNGLGLQGNRRIAFNLFYRIFGNFFAKGLILDNLIKIRRNTLRSAVPIVVDGIAQVAALGPRTRKGHVIVGHGEFAVSINRHIARSPTVEGIAIQRGLLGHGYGVVVLHNRFARQSRRASRHITVVVLVRNFMLVQLPIALQVDILLGHCKLIIDNGNVVRRPALKGITSYCFGNRSSYLIIIRLRLSARGCYAIRYITRILIADFEDVLLIVYLDDVLRFIRADGQREILCLIKDIAGGAIIVRRNRLNHRAKIYLIKILRCNKDGFILIVFNRVGILNDRPLRDKGFIRVNADFISRLVCRFSVLPARKGIACAGGIRYDGMLLVLIERVDFGYALAHRTVVGIIGQGEGGIHVFVNGGKGQGVVRIQQVLDHMHLIVYKVLILFRILPADEHHRAVLQHRAVLHIGIGVDGIGLAIHKTRVSVVSRIIHDLVLVGIGEIGIEDNVAVDLGIKVERSIAATRCGPAKEGIVAIGNFEHGQAFRVDCAAILYRNQC